MKTIGIIAEFNPFHNGHSYLIKKAKAVTGADNVVVVMSGNYVQRGEPAFMNKFFRTKVALENGADVVIELPFCYAAASANYFATGAISLLNSLGIIDYLCFGCENDNLKLLSSISDVILEEGDTYSKTLQTYLKSGMSFAKSRMNAIIKSLALKGIPIDGKELSDILDKPNTILAIEYLSALKVTKSSMKPVVIKRASQKTSIGYGSGKSSGNSSGKSTGNTLETNVDSIFRSEHNPSTGSEFIHSDLSSAHSIRNLYKGKSVYSFSNVKKSLMTAVPENCIEMLENEYQITYPVTMNDFSQIIGKSIIDSKYNDEDLSDLFDTTRDLANRLLNASTTFNNTEEFVNKCNSPTITSSRIKRILLYKIFDYKKTDFFTFRDNGYVFYIRVLGFRKNKDTILNAIHKNSELPIITKISSSMPSLSPYAKKMLSHNMLVDETYRLVVMSKYNSKIKTEQESGVVMI